MKYDAIMTGLWSVGADIPLLQSNTKRFILNKILIKSGAFFLVSCFYYIANIMTFYFAKWSPFSRH